MLTPNVCLTCGHPIGDVSEIFRDKYRERIQKALDDSGIPPTEASLEASIVKLEGGVKVDDILNALQIHNDCCRMHMTTAMDWRDYY